MSPGVALVPAKAATPSTKDVNNRALPPSHGVEATVAECWKHFASVVADEAFAASAFTAFSSAQQRATPLTRMNEADGGITLFKPPSPPPLHTPTTAIQLTPPASNTAPAVSPPPLPAKPTQTEPPPDVQEGNQAALLAAGAQERAGAGALAAVQRAHAAVKDANADLEARRKEVVAAVQGAGRHSPEHWLARGGLHDAQNTLLSASGALYSAMTALSEADGSAALVATACKHAAKLLKLPPEAPPAPGAAAKKTWADLHHGHSKAALCLDGVMQHVARASNAHELVQLSTLQRALAEICGELDRLSAVAGDAFAAVASCSRLAKASSAVRAATDGEPVQWREAAFYLKTLAEYYATMMPPVKHRRFFSLCQTSSRLQLMAQRAAVRADAGSGRSIVKSKLRCNGAVYRCALCALGRRAPPRSGEAAAAGDWAWWEAEADAAEHMASFHGLPVQLAANYVRCEQLYVPYTALCCGICEGPVGPLGLRWGHWRYARAHLPHHQHVCHRVDPSTSASLVRSELDYIFEQTASQLGGGMDDEDYGIQSCEMWLESETA